MASQFGSYYNLVKEAFKFIGNSEQIPYASFEENADTLTLTLNVKDGDDTLQFIYIWGNNPLSVIYKDEVKVFSVTPEQAVDKILYIIQQWKKKKTI